MVVHIPGNLLKTLQRQKETPSCFYIQADTTNYIHILKQ